MSPVDYHAWTHRPKSKGGTDPIEITPEIPWARLAKGFDAANQSISNNSLTTITWNHEVNMGAGESGAAYFQPDVSNGIEIQQAGVYAITAQVYWAATVNFPWAMEITGQAADWPPTQPGYYDTGGATLTQGMLSYTHAYPANWNIALSVYQLSGGSRNVDAAYLEIFYLGSYTGSAFDTLNPAA